PGPSRPLTAGRAPMPAAAAERGGRAAPGKRRRREEIPECGDQRSGKPRSPIRQRFEEQPLGNGDVDEGTDAACRVEAEQAAPDPGPPQPLIAIGKDVVEEKIARHRRPRRDQLAEKKIPRDGEKQRQRSELDADAGDAYCREKEEP